MVTDCVDSWQIVVYILAVAALPQFQSHVPQAILNHSLHYPDPNVE